MWLWRPNCYTAKKASSLATATIIHLNCKHTWAGVTPTRPLAFALRDRTGGNAFYFRELVRWLTDEGGLEGHFRELGLQGGRGALTILLEGRHHPIQVVRLDAHGVRRSR